MFNMAYFLLLYYNKRDQKKKKKEKSKTFIKSVIAKKNKSNDFEQYHNIIIYSVHFSEHSAPLAYIAKTFGNKIKLL